MQYTKESVERIVNVAIKATVKSTFGMFFDHSNQHQWHAKITEMMESNNLETKEIGRILGSAYNLMSMNNLLSAEEYAADDARSMANG